MRLIYFVLFHTYSDSAGFGRPPQRYNVPVLGIWLAVVDIEGEGAVAIGLGGAPVADGPRWQSFSADRTRLVATTRQLLDMDRGVRACGPVAQLRVKVMCLRGELWRNV